MYDSLWLLQTSLLCSSLFSFCIYVHSPHKLEILFSISLTNSRVAYISSPRAPPLPTLAMVPLYVPGLCRHHRVWTHIWRLGVRSLRLKRTCDSVCLGLVTSPNLTFLVLHINTSGLVKYFVRILSGLEVEVQFDHCWSLALYSQVKILTFMNF